MDIVEWAKEEMIRTGKNNCKKDSFILIKINMAIFFTET